VGLKALAFSNSDLKNAYQRLARAFEDLDLQQELVLKLRTDRHDTNDAEAAFRTMRRPLETYEEDRREIEEESDQHEGQRTAQAIEIRAIHLGWTTVAIL
jgi:hypothetical protein